jgi:succinate dehydrogenase / fumarate reductase flavoprotein subunit
MELNSRVPSGPLEEKWNNHRFSNKLVNPANRRKYSAIVVGTGLAGASASATLAEQGYQVKTFCISDSPRRAHSIAAQGGINAAKNYQNDGDSVHRLFYDTIKGGDFRAREANVHRLAEISTEIIDQCDLGKGVGGTGLAVYLDFTEAIKRDGAETIFKKYGNLFQIYEKITDSNPMVEPMMIYPAVHYTMGGLWVDYDLMTTIPGLFAIGECNFSDHGANRLGASALMQGLADGYFVIATSVAHYLGTNTLDKVSEHDSSFIDSKREVEDRISKLLKNSSGGPAGKFTVDEIHKELGKLMWDNCGMARNKEDLEKALEELPNIKQKFWGSAYIPGTTKEINQSLERAGRVADFLEFAEIMIRDALAREESCGCHLREESQTEENEAKRDDANYSHVSVWEHPGEDNQPEMHKESLTFEFVTPSQRSYK